MTQKIEKIEAIASNYDVIVFDQWGVLHNGSKPYPGAIAAIDALQGQLAVLSNSGKRSAPNAERIIEMGFSETAFDYVMTSGEALWRDVDGGQIAARNFYAVERTTGDATTWADGLDIDVVSDLGDADAILMMGLPDGAHLDDWTEQLGRWNAKHLPMYCSNPDRKSPRAGGALVTSPGALAFAYAEIGGTTTFYGKPHQRVFQALEAIFGPGNYLMVGDSMEHDIAGAHGVRWDSLLIQGGLYFDRFQTVDAEQVITEIAAEKKCALPTYRIEGLR